MRPANLTDVGLSQRPLWLGFIQKADLLSCSFGVQNCRKKMAADLDLRVFVADEDQRPVTGIPHHVTRLVRVVEVIPNRRWGPRSAARARPRLAAGSLGGLDRPPTSQINSSSDIHGRTVDFYQRLSSTRQNTFGGPVAVDQS